MVGKPIIPLRDDQRGHSGGCHEIRKQLPPNIIIGQPSQNRDIVRYSLSPFLEKGPLLARFHCSKEIRIFVDLFRPFIFSPPFFNIEHLRKEREKGRKVGVGVRFPLCCWCCLCWCWLFVLCEY